MDGEEARALIDRTNEEIRATEKRLNDLLNLRASLSVFLPDGESAQPVASKETWVTCIRRVMTLAGRPLTLTEIADGLIRGGMNRGRESRALRTSITTILHTNEHIFKRVGYGVWSLREGATSEAVEESPGVNATWPDHIAAVIAANGKPMLTSEIVNSVSAERGIGPEGRRSVSRMVGNELTRNGKGRFVHKGRGLWGLAQP